MKNRAFAFAFAALAVLASLNGSRAQTLTSDQLAERTVHRRAVEAVIWGMPAVNFDLMFQAMRQGRRASQPGRLLVAACRTGRTRR